MLKFKVFDVIAQKFWGENDLELVDDADAGEFTLCEFAKISGSGRMGKHISLKPLKEKSLKSTQ